MDARVGAPARELLAWSAGLRTKAGAVLAAVSDLDRFVGAAVESLRREAASRDRREGALQRFDLDPTSSATADVLAALRRRERVQAATRAAVERAKEILAAGD